MTEDTIDLVRNYFLLEPDGAAILLPGGARHSLVSQNGTAGASRPRVVEFQYPFPPGAMLVMHSDGVGAHWELATYPGLRVKHPSLIAGVLFRDHRRERDDASVVVVKDRPHTPAA